MKRAVIAAAIASTLVVASWPAVAYSVLTHEALVDALWDTAIARLLRERFPGATPERLSRARAYAYGGSVIQDLGYYPFGSHFFTDLSHYVRSGDFVEALIRNAQAIDEYAFALGALAHYASDNTGHPIAVNRAVPIIYPKLRAKFGDEVTYAEAPKHHVMVEFAFDVLQIARGAYQPDAYQQFVGFEVAKPVIERAFREIYGLEVKDLFLDADLAIGTYRHAVSTVIPEMTRVAWREKRDEIEKLTPGLRETDFIFTMTRQQYEQRFGTGYRKPGVLSRFLTFLFKLIPKIGPLRPLAFETPTPEAERLFVESFARARERYGTLLEAVGRGRLNLPNMDFDTGRPAAAGEYPLADETYAELLDTLADRKFAGTPAELRRNIATYYASGVPPGRTGKERKRAETVRQHLALLNASDK